MIPENLIRVLSVDDHHIFREGLANIIRQQPDMKLVAQASNGPDGIQQFREHLPDVTIMDLRLPDLSGIDALIAIRNEFPNARIIMLTTFDGDAEVQRAMKAGASGYFLKSGPPEELMEAIRKVQAGNKRLQPELASQMVECLDQETLSERETEVLKQVAAGRRNLEISKRLFISEDTVKAHLRHIIEKLGARDRTHAVAIAERRGIIRF